MAGPTITTVQAVFNRYPPNYVAEGSADIAQTMAGVVEQIKQLTGTTWISPYEDLGFTGDEGPGPAALFIRNLSSTLLVEVSIKISAVHHSFNLIGPNQMILLAAPFPIGPGVWIRPYTSAVNVLIFSSEA